MIFKKDVLLEHLPGSSAFMVNLTKTLFPLILFFFCYSCQNASFIKQPLINWIAFHKSVKDGDDSAHTY